MSKVDNSYIIEEIKSAFPEGITGIEEPYGLLSMEANSSLILDLLKWLKEHPVIQGAFLTDICGAHFPGLKGRELAVIYHVHSLVNNVRIRIRCFMPAENPVIPSSTGLFDAANWMERETYDFYGIIFTGHPNLKRILNVDEMDYFPLRKEYPLEDGTRTDKDDSYFGR